MCTIYRIIVHIKTGFYLLISERSPHPPAIPKRVQTLGLWTATQIRCKTNLYFVLYKNECGGLSDCEELVGVNSKGRS